MRVQDFSKEYERKTDGELMQLAMEADQLTPEANLALQEALSLRGINQSEGLAVLRHEEQLRKAKEARYPGRLCLFHGFGRERYGKAAYSRSSGIERFQTTVFIVLFWLPLIPISTHVVERNRQTSQMAVLEKLPIDWEQVLKVWIVTAAILLALVWASRIYLRTLLTAILNWQ